MWPLVAVLLQGLFCWGSAQLLLKKIKSVEFNAHNRTLLIPCLATNAEPEHIAEMYVKWKFKEKYILVFDGAKETSTVDRDFPSAKIDASELLKGNASLQLEKRHARIGNYTCEVTELLREGELTVELKYSGSTQLLFKNIESVEFNARNRTLLIPCLVSNAGADYIDEMYVKWKFKAKYILIFDGANETSTVDRAFPSAKIDASELLKGNASLQLDKRDALIGNYTCEVTELLREGELTVELKYSGSTHFLFKKIKSVEFNVCNRTLLIPCLVSNAGADYIDEMYVKWKFKEKYILIFDGAKQTSTVDRDFPSAKIDASELLKGNASLQLDMRDARIGNYTCELRELIREGELTVELKYTVSWFTHEERNDITMVSFFILLLFWGQFVLLMYQSTFPVMLKKNVILCIFGPVITGFTVIGGLLFTPGEYSQLKSYGLYLLVCPLGILILLQYIKFQLVPGKSIIVIFILMIIQLMGFGLAGVGLILSISACVSAYSSSVISGLAIMAAAELLGLIYIIHLDPRQGISSWKIFVPVLVALLIWVAFLILRE